MLETMKLTGVVDRVQVQSQGLRNNGVYDPAPLVIVDHLILEPDGIIGVTADGKTFFDIHHVRHPQSRSKTHNRFSFGFIGHYDAIRSQYGPHIANGTGGENIIIQYDGRLQLSDLGQQVAFENAITGKIIVMDTPHFLAPCEPFSRFVRGNSTSTDIKSVLQFLGDGMRGFCAQPGHFDETPTIRAGDRFYIYG